MAEDRDYRALGNALHNRLVAGNDNRVTAEISELFLPLLANALKRRFPSMPDPHLIETVAIDTLMNYFEQPEKFEPAKRSLIGYLYLDAYWNVIDILRASQKCVELHPSTPEYVDETDDPEERLIKEASPLVQKALAEVTGPVDRELLALMMDGVRETGPYAEALGIQDRSPDEQAAIVKRHKDRLKKALRRRINRQGGRK